MASFWTIRFSLKHCDGVSVVEKDDSILGQFLKTEESQRELKLRKKY
jgi:hypothetical protein